MKKRLVGGGVKTRKKQGRRGWEGIRDKVGDQKREKVNK